MATALGIDIPRPPEEDNEDDTLALPPLIEGGEVPDGYTAPSYLALADRYKPPIVIDNEILEPDALPQFAPDDEGDTPDTGSERVLYPDPEHELEKDEEIPAIEPVEERSFEGLIDSLDALDRPSLIKLQYDVNEALRNIPPEEKEKHRELLDLIIAVKSKLTEAQ